MVIFFDTLCFATGQTSHRTGIEEKKRVEDGAKPPIIRPI